MVSFLVCLKRFGSDERITSRGVDFGPLLHVGPLTKFFRSYVLYKFDRVFSLFISNFIFPMIKMCGDSICREFNNSLKLLSNTLSLIQGGL